MPQVVPRADLHSTRTGRDPVVRQSFPIDIRRITDISKAGPPVAQSDTYGPVPTALAKDLRVGEIKRSSSGHALAEGKNRYEFYEATEAHTRSRDPWAMNEKALHAGKKLDVTSGNWQAEHEKDDDKSEVYFLVNLDPRVVRVNGVDVPQFDVAGPMPDFAILECPGGQVGFWWGVDGEQYEPDLDEHWFAEGNWGDGADWKKQDQSSHNGLWRRDPRPAMSKRLLGSADGYDTEEAEQVIENVKKPHEDRPFWSFDTILPPPYYKPTASGAVLRKRCLELGIKQRGPPWLMNQWIIETERRIKHGIPPIKFETERARMARIESDDDYRIFHEKDEEQEGVEAEKAYHPSYEQQDAVEGDVRKHLFVTVQLMSDEEALTKYRAFIDTHVEPESAFNAKDLRTIEDPTYQEEEYELFAYTASRELKENLEWEEQCKHDIQDDSQSADIKEVIEEESQKLGEIYEILTSATTGSHPDAEVIELCRTGLMSQFFSMRDNHDAALELPYPPVPDQFRPRRPHRVEPTLRIKESDDESMARYHLARIAEINLLIRYHRTVKESVNMFLAQFHRFNKSWIHPFFSGTKKRQFRKLRKIWRELDQLRRRHDAEDARYDISKRARRQMWDEAEIFYYAQEASLRYVFAVIDEENYKNDIGSALTVCNSSVYIAGTVNGIAEWLGEVLTLHNRENQEPGNDAGEDIDSYVSDADDSAQSVSSEEESPRGVFGRWGEEEEGERRKSKNFRCILDTAELRDGDTIWEDNEASDVEPLKDPFGYDPDSDELFTTEDPDLPDTKEAKAAEYLRYLRMEEQIALAFLDSRERYDHCSPEDFATARSELDDIRRKRNGRIRKIDPSAVVLRQHEAESAIELEIYALRKNISLLTSGREIRSRSTLEGLNELLKDRQIARDKLMAEHDKVNEAAGVEEMDDNKDDDYHGDDDEMDVDDLDGDDVEDEGLQEILEQGKLQARANFKIPTRSRKQTDIETAWKGDLPQVRFQFGVKESTNDHPTESDTYSAVKRRRSKKQPSSFAAEEEIQTSTNPQCRPPCFRLPPASDQYSKTTMAALAAVAANKEQKLQQALEKEKKRRRDTIERDGTGIEDVLPTYPPHIPPGGKIARRGSKIIWTGPQGEERQDRRALAHEPIGATQASTRIEQPSPEATSAAAAATVTSADLNVPRTKQPKGAATQEKGIRSMPASDPRKLDAKHRMWEHERQDFDWLQPLRAGAVLGGHSMRARWERMGPGRARRLYGGEWEKYTMGG
jgi:hypothetical protein